ncbi:hypothetical protein B0H10DRAFT_2439478 [Mycena sp. CBHHK59/15]|nr:hypothetical protein B0H10DRAFT_2439478 [Mycena sp. CBHHK59/15]
MMQAKSFGPQTGSNSRAHSFWPYDQVPFVRAAAKYRNGDIRLTFQSSCVADFLREEADHWLPAFSSLLQLRTPPTFPVIMHRVSTDLNVGSGLFDDEVN